MATHDYVIDNSTGANVRADLNLVLQAILSNNSSSSAPSTTAAYMWWADTTNGILKIRNSANNAWVELLQLDGTLTLEDGSVSSPALAFRDDLNTGLYSSAADTFNVATGGVERMELGAATVFNEDGADVDFRIEGDTEANLFYVDAGNDRVGISTANPTGTLSIESGTYQSTAPDTTGDDFVISGNQSLGMSFITLASGSSNNNIYFGDTDDTNIGMIRYAHADNSLQFQTNTQERMRIDSSGNLLLGTTSASGGSNPILHINQASDTQIYLGNTATSASGTCGLVFAPSNNITGSQIECFAEEDFSSSANQTAGLKFTTRKDGSLLERLRIDSSGRVGIGTTSPTSTLFVNGTSLSHVFTARTSDSNGNCIINILSEGTTGNSRILFSDTAGADAIISYSHNDGGLIFGSHGAVEDMRLDSSGRLLVNQTSTSIATKVVTTVTAGTSASWAQCGLAVTHASAINRKALIGFGFSGNGGTNPPAAIGSISTDTASFENAALVFYTRSATTDTEPSERMRIDSSGRVYINNTAAIDPSQLVVKGAYPITPIEVQQDTASNHFVMTFRNANGLVGNIITQGSSTTYNTSSDYRLKENATTISDGITRLKSLKPYRFNFKVDTDTTVDGFFAHEVTPIVPEAISGTKDEVVTQSMIDEGKYNEGTLNNPIYQGIDQSKLVPLLVAAVQELITKVETLEAA